MAGVPVVVGHVGVATRPTGPARSSSGCSSMNASTGSEPDFLVALEEEAEVHRRAAGALQPRLGRREVHEELALVVAGAAGVDDVVLVARLERRPHPLVERIGRLHVVVAVDEHRRGTLAGAQPVRGDDGVGDRLVDRHAIDAHGRHPVRDPLGGFVDLWLARRVRRHRLDAEEVVEPAHVLVDVAAEVGDRRVEAGGGIGLAEAHGRIVGLRRMSGALPCPRCPDACPCCSPFSPVSCSSPDGRQRLRPAAA